MSETETTKQPDPTFLKDDKTDLRKPLGLVIEKRMAIEKRMQILQDEPKEPRLSRKEVEALLDGYYAVNDKSAESAENMPSPYHARLAGRQMVRNLALVSSLALFFGFGLGLYGLSQQGAETRLGQKFNQSLTTVWQMVTPSATDPAATGRATTGRETGSGKFVTANRQQVPATLAPTVKPTIKPIKTASLVVNDASGTIQAGIPLKLSLNADTDTSLLKIKIMNVPDDAVLTAGIKRSDGVWILKPADLTNVSLVVSSDRKTPLRLDIELIEARTGELMSPTREIRVAIIQSEPFTVGGLQ